MLALSHVTEPGVTTDQTGSSGLGSSPIPSPSRFQSDVNKEELHKLV